MNTDLISRADAEALFRTARSKLNPSDYKTADEFNTRDLMLLNAEQMIHLLPFVNPQPCEDAISRQAAIQAIYNNINRLNIAKAVHDLPSVQPMPCNYAISRAEVHDLLATWLSDKLDEKTREVLEVIDGKVEDMPSVTPKQRTGHWIKRPNGFKCSKCLIVYQRPSIFCPNCGAKMVEPQESEGQA